MSTSKYLPSLFDGAFLQIPVITITGTPPAHPSEGDLHIVAATGTSGVFEEHEDEYALYLNSAWKFYTPINYQVVMLAGTLYVYITGTGWGAL